MSLSCPKLELMHYYSKLYLISKIERVWFNSRITIISSAKELCLFTCSCGTWKVKIWNLYKNFPNGAVTYNTLGWGDAETQLEIIFFNKIMLNGMKISKIIYFTCENCKETCSNNNEEVVHFCVSIKPRKWKVNWTLSCQSFVFIWKKDMKL